MSGDGIHNVVTRGADHTIAADLGKLQGRVTNGRFDARLILRYQEQIHEGRDNQRDNCDRNDTERSELIAMGKVLGAFGPSTRTIPSSNVRTHPTS